MIPSMNAKILLVDDIGENLKLLRSILGNEYDLFFAKNGLDALSLSDTHHPDLILLDIMMPDMDGYEVCRRLKADEKCLDIPVIFITSKILPEDEIKGFELGAVDYITKPISPPVVRARVRTHLQLAIAQKKLANQNQLLEKEVRRRTEELQLTRLEIIRRLGRAAEYRDNETGLHVIRMSHYSRLVGLAMGLSDDHADLLLNASPMHDIGKVGIPDQVLLKPDKLNGEEWSIMKQHPEIGSRIIGEHHSELLSMARVICLSHHEKWNGSGYPDGLHGEAIPLEGRIVAIADVFDALTAERPYKKPFPLEMVLGIIRNEKDQHFDPRVVDAFFSILPDILAIREKYLDR